jgi:hypothetical protein
MVDHGCTNPGRLVTWVTKFCTVALNIFSTVTAVFFPPDIQKNVYQCTCTEQKKPDKGEVHRSLQYCGSPIRGLLHVTVLGRSILRWLLDFWKTCRTLQYVDNTLWWREVHQRYRGNENKSKERLDGQAVT